VNRLDFSVQNAIGEALPACQVYVCTQPANTASIPPSPLATLWKDTAGTIPLDNPVIVDGNGNGYFYAPTGIYTLVYFDPYNRIPTLVFPDQQVVTQGGGSVTSVGATIPDGFAISGSPVTSSGVLGISYSTDWLANTVVAGPTSGGPGAPTRRKLVAADIAGLVGSVTSVNASVTPGALFTALFAGGPITSSGTLALSFDFNPQTANKFIAGPASGGLGAMTARLMVPPDLPAPAVVAFSATPTFDGSSSLSFITTLTGDVTGPVFSGGVSGQIYTFMIKQDAIGSHSFAWPANVQGGGVIDPTPNAVNIQSFMSDGVNLYPTGNMITQI
jgi:hypothetical protein